MKRVEEQYKAENLKVIWMGFQDKKSKIIDFMSKHDIDSSVGYDARNLISKKYGIRYGAGLIMINREGIVKERVPKGLSEKALIETIEHVVHETEGEVKNK